jgi:hypothetical protein
MMDEHSLFAARLNQAAMVSSTVGGPAGGGSGRPPGDNRAVPLGGYAGLEVVVVEHLSSCR